MYSTGGENMKVNRKLILLLVFVMIIGILGGCAESGELPDGIENKRFFKDFSSTYGTIMRSMRDHSYNEDKVNESLAKLNSYVDNKKLNDYEILIVNTLNENIGNIKNDLTQGDKTITTKTLDEFGWLIDSMSDYFKNKNNK